MSAGYRVILDDLQAAASIFPTEASALQKINIDPPSAASGDDTLDSIIKALMDTFGVYRDAIPEKLRDHGKKLQQCHDNYHQNEADVVEVYNNVMSQLGG